MKDQRVHAKPLFVQQRGECLVSVRDAFLKAISPPRNKGEVLKNNDL